MFLLFYDSFTCLTDTTNKITSWLYICSLSIGSNPLNKIRTSRNTLIKIGHFSPHFIINFNIQRCTAGTFSLIDNSSLKGLRLHFIPVQLVIPIIPVTGAIEVFRKAEEPKPKRSEELFRTVKVRFNS